jgi:hypothetical protein
VAVYAERGLRRRGPVAGRRRGPSWSLIPLEGLTGQFPTTGDRFSPGYAESVRRSDYLVRTYSPTSLVSLIRSYADGRTDDEAFKAAIGVDVASFGDAWLRTSGRAPTKYGPKPPCAGTGARGVVGGAARPRRRRPGASNAARAGGSCAGCARAVREWHGPDRPGGVRALALLIVRRSSSHGQAAAARYPPSDGAAVDAARARRRTPAATPRDGRRRRRPADDAGDGVRRLGPSRAGRSPSASRCSPSASSSPHSSPRRARASATRPRSGRRCSRPPAAPDPAGRAQGADPRPARADPGDRDQGEEPRPWSSSSTASSSRRASRPG